MTLALTLVSLVAALLALLASSRPSAGRRARGKVVLFVALFVLPALLTGVGVQAHLEQSKSTSFCLSCHTMEPYGQSLWRDDPDYVVANHFQNRLVDREEACYTCHTSYTMFGDIDAKMKGLKHLLVYYVGEVPDEIELYEPYENRECLHCHEGSRTFEEGETHAEFREDLGTGETSCLECHDLIHGVEDLGGADFWEDPQLAVGVYQVERETGCPLQIAVRWALADGLDVAVVSGARRELDLRS